MEAAAKTVELLTQRILPQEPHHLSYSPDWRHRAPPPPPPNPAKKHSAAAAARFDEWHHPRLQYLTFVSDADRGVLLTRPDYDMREEELPKPPGPREVAALAAKPAGEKKKLSLSDYKKKTTTTATSTIAAAGGAESASPPEPPAAKRNEAERAPSPPAAAVSAAADSKPTPDKRAPEARRPERPISKGMDSPADGKQQRSRDNAADMTLPIKPPIKHPLPPKPPTPDTKKRPVDVDDESRPPKRPRPDAGRPPDDRSHPSSRDDPPRRKDRDSLPSRDLTPQKEGKASTSSLPNGRSILKDAMGSSGNPSPVSRSRGNSVNGVRPAAPGSSRETPSRLDTSSKTSVPPLLSPLNLDLDDKNERESKADKRRREDVPEAARPAKPKKPEAPPPSRKRSPMSLPPLLSPTLPPEIEAELHKRKKSPPKTSDGRPKDDGDSSLPAKKVRAEQADAEGGDKPRRKRFMVTLKVNKRLRQDFRRILALPGRRDVQRTASSDASQAKKRPSSASEAPTEPAPAKRPRTSDMPGPSKPAAPSTPSKKGTAMSRVSSSNSHTNTPGMGPGATPSAAGSSERLADSQADQLEMATLREREGRYSSLGKRLKHDGDEVLKGHHGANGARPRKASVKLAHVLTLESVIAFMASFQTQNRHRALAHKPTNPTGWASLFPLMEQRRSEMRAYSPLLALLLLLHAVSLEEAVKCYWTFGDPGAHVSVQEVARHERARTRVLGLLRETLERGGDAAPRLDVHPWSTVDEVSEACLRAMRRYCADEGVDWRPEVNLKDGATRTA